MRSKDMKNFSIQLPEPIAIHGAPPQQSMALRLPVATNYDVDNEYNYIMDKALNAYKKHCEKEKADARQSQLRSSFKRRMFLSQGPRSPRHPPGGRPRPWSALPSKFDAIKEVDLANNESRDSTPRKVLNVRTITLGSGTMDVPTKKATSYQRRNQTSHSWYSQSFPSASFLQQPITGLTISKSRSLNTSPVKAEEKKKRPSTTYEYDGGVFAPTTPRRDFFVIHPDWVSESVTVQKLSLNERTKKSSTWPGRRCRSAPPPKFRNPITWD
ncbi:uncharacterized protein [Haliotis asinina]|uniref:uncharacterized protein isoform X1 n=1 Tax=Haliotis asinina TaxID=109174 RepID=UPI0035320B08